KPQFEGLQQKMLPEVQGLNSLVNELQRVQTAVAPLRPSLQKKVAPDVIARNAAQIIDICKKSPEVGHPFIQAILHSAEKLANNPAGFFIEQVQQMSANLDEHRKVRSLFFFQDGDASLFNLLQAALADATVSH